jgi:hypothetical protein
VSSITNGTERDALLDAMPVGRQRRLLALETKGNFVTPVHHVVSLHAMHPRCEWPDPVRLRANAVARSNVEAATLAPSACGHCFVSPTTQMAKRVGIRIVTFETCSGFTRVPAGLLSRLKRPLSRGSNRAVR